MTVEPAGQGTMLGRPSLASGGDPSRIGYRLQILSTEHWGLLATRSLTWNEIFTRASMFLSALSGALVALALVAQVSSFGDSFTIFALVILPVVFFLGLTTYVRLIQATREDRLWVTGMNRLRAGYLEIAPELAPYLITSPHDDFAGMLVTAGAPQAGWKSLLFPFVTTPSVIWVIDGVLAGAILAIAIGELGALPPVAFGAGAAGALATVVAGLAFGRRVVLKWFDGVRPLNPTTISSSEATNRILS
jgi:hypothetical protein